MCTRCSQCLPYINNEQQQQKHTHDRPHFTDKWTCRLHWLCCCCWWFFSSLFFSFHSNWLFGIVRYFFCIFTLARAAHFFALSSFHSIVNFHTSNRYTDRFFFWFIRWDRNRMTVRRCSIWLRTQLAIAICCKVLMWKREHPVLVRNSARHVFRIRNHRWEPKMFYKRTIKKAEKEILTSRYYKTNVQGYQLFPPASFSFAICGLSDIKLGRMMKFDEQKCSRLNWNW